MVALPVAMPVIIPVVEPIVATRSLLLLQIPPIVALVMLVVLKTHTFTEAGTMATGVVFTVIVFRAEHPDTLV